MRLSTTLTAVLAAGPAVVSAAGNLGFALGSKNPDGTCKTQADYEADLVAIADQSSARTVRIYAADQCNTAQFLLPAAAKKGFKVILGIWADTDESFAADKKAIVKFAPQFKDSVYAITVGSESLYRGNFTGDQLLAKIKDVKGSLPQFKVGTADSWNKYADGTADPIIKGGADILLCNAFSYWQGQTIANATGSFFDDIMQAFGHIQSVSGSTDRIEMWVGETGWPTQGNKYEAAEPGLENAKAYYHSAVCGIVDWGFNVFSFEAFDESWKPDAIGQNGVVASEKHWGVMTDDRKPKFSLRC